MGYSQCDSSSCVFLVTKDSCCGKCGQSVNFFLTILLGVGLFFFIKASTKDRTEVAEF
ncbi:MAG: cofactor assembly of complex C subunit B, partial [Leptolyngbya sp. SIO3F4]|nr:cofactor assembly of complex C subunit B [Leptolyngbya sp. SIO3F4]